MATEDETAESVIEESVAESVDEKWPKFVERAGEALTKKLASAGITSSATMEIHFTTLENIKGIGQATARKIRTAWSNI